MEGVLDTICTSAQHTLREAGLSIDGPPLLLAVSGGCDSIALLHVVLELGYRVAVAHVDHGTRGDASRADAAFVVSLAQGLDLECHACRHDVPAEAHAAGVSVEQQGRSVRYAFFANTARQHGYAAILTGHHADDQAETLLLRLIRGTGPEGLGGMAPARDLDGFPLVRPLLACRRRQLAACAVQEGWVYREDASNADTIIPRNRVRHELLPLLTEYNPAIVEALCRLASVQRLQEELVAPRMEEAWATCVDGSDIDRAAFSALNVALQFRLVARFLQAHGVDHPYARVAELAAFVAAAPTGKYGDMGGGLRLYAGRTHAVAIGETATGKQDPPTPLAVPGETAALGHHFYTEALETPPEQPAGICGPDCQIFDAQRLEGELSVRTRRPGDRFIPLGMTGTRKLKDYFIDLGLPAPTRDQVPIVVDDAGIVWIVGHAPAARVCVDAQTARCLLLRVAPAEANHAP